jgi:sugar (pentulose or hexulose) kinase
MVDDIPPLGGVWGNLFKVMGLSRDIRRVQCEAEVNWVRHNQPDIWKKTSKVLLLSGYLTHRLTGEYRDSSACIVGWLPFNYRTHKWEGAASWKWKTMLVERQMLPELVSPGEVLGHITRQVEKETGIPAGIPLIAAAADKACEVLGSGCLTSDMGCLSYGTTATLNVTYYKYLEAIPLLPPYPGPLPGTYNPEMDVKRGFWLVSWFKNEFGLREMQIAQERGIEAEELFDELVNAVPPGSLGLTLQPYWMPGFRTLDQSAKGAIIGFGEVHTRAHIYRAILEGLVYALREGKERVEQRGKVQIKELSACGGGARSRAALQITADIFGLPVSRPQTVETASLGAAIEGAVGLKMYPEFMTAVKGMVRKELTLMPDPEAQKLYEQLYSRVYKKMYERLKPLYEEIQKITGYPDPLDY